MCNVAYVAHTVRKPLSRIIENCHCMACSKNGDNTAVLLTVILYSCIPDPLLCHVGNLNYSHILFGAGNWCATEESCHWCV